MTDITTPAQVRAAALEEAATLCDEIGNGVADLVLTGLPEQARLRESMAASFTKAGQCIRALIEKGTT